MSKNKIIFGLAIFIIFFLGCEDTIECEFREYNINLITGQQQLVNGQFLMYSGLISDSVFAISHTGRTSNNVFYPTNLTNFSLYKHNFTLIEISPKNIVLSYNKEHCS